MITSKHRRLAQKLHAAYNGSAERYDRTVWGLVEKRCVLRGIPFTKDYPEDYSMERENNWRMTRRIYDGIVDNVGYRSDFIEKQVKKSGFTFVGSGMARAAYAHESCPEVVFKVLRNAECRPLDNITEARISQKWHRCVSKAPESVQKFWHIPAARMAYGILVAERVAPVSGDGDSSSVDHRAFREFMNSLGYGVRDDHGGNVWWDGRRMVFVDLGHFIKLS